MAISKDLQMVLENEIKSENDSTLHKMGAGWILKHGFNCSLEKDLNLKWYRWKRLNEMFDEFDIDIYKKGNGSSYCSKIGATIMECNKQYKESGLVPFIKEFVNNKREEVHNYKEEIEDLSELNERIFIKNEMLTEELKYNSLTKDSIVLSSIVASTISFFCFAIYSAL